MSEECTPMGPGLVRYGRQMDRLEQELVMGALGDANAALEELVEEAQTPEVRARWERLQAWKEAEGEL